MNLSAHFIAQVPPFKADIRTLNLLTGCRATGDIGLRRTRGDFLRRPPRRPTRTEAPGGPRGAESRGSAQSSVQGHRAGRVAW